jgi:hypothetical protein
MPKSITAAQLENYRIVIGLYNSGMPSNEIANLTEINLYNVRNILKKYEKNEYLLDTIKVKDESQVRRGLSKYSQEQIDEMKNIIEKYNNNYTYFRIIEEVNAEYREQGIDKKLTKSKIQRVLEKYKADADFISKLRLKQPPIYRKKHTQKCENCLNYLSKKVDETIEEVLDQEIEKILDN